MARRPQVGDIFEFWTRCGLAYLQYIQEDETYGSLARVLAGVYDTRPHDVQSLANTQRFSVFVPVVPAVRAGDLVWVGHAAVPLEFREPPTLRQEMGAGGYLLTRGGVELDWRRRPSEEDFRYQVATVWDFGLLEERVASDWSWSDDRGLQSEPAPPHSPCHELPEPRRS